MDFLPSKKIVVPLIAALFIVGGSFLVSNWETIIKTRQTAAQNSGLIYLKEDQKNIKKTDDLILKIKQALGNKENMNGLLTKTTPENNVFRPYELKDLDILPNENEAGLKEYGTSLSSAFKNYSDPQKRNIVELGLSLYETGNETIVSELDDIEQIQLNTVKNLLDVKPTVDIAEIHLGTINTIFRMAFLIENIKSIRDEQATGLIATQEYAKESYNLVGFIGLINQRFIDKNIEFDLKDKTEVSIDIIN